MKRNLLFVAVCTSLFLLCAFQYTKTRTGTALKQVSRQELMKVRSIKMCSPDWSLINEDSFATGIGILHGWGNYRWDIDSPSDSARLYFQQGISMYYAFHIIESMASFKKAGKFDTVNAMIYWAQALAYGPNINDFAYAFTPEAFATTQKAIALSSNCTPKEKALIRAMGVRYSLDSMVSRASLNQLYADEMKKNFVSFPEDADIGALYADALMLQHPWDLWQHDDNPQPWTPELVQVLEKTLGQSPLHPGANHYYIHSVEASKNPQKALASADRLSELMPSVSHMVHMPSHIYIRSGYYAKGMRVNELSLKGYHDYLSKYPDVVNNIALYKIHNAHMQAACAMLGAGYSYSSVAADSARTSFDTSFMSLPDPFGNFIQYVYMTPVINDVRFGKWENILKAAAAEEQHVYANVILHWARGMAQARTNNLEEAKKELQFVSENKDKGGMTVVLTPFNSPFGSAKVAEKLLQGVIAEQEGKYSLAVELLTQAAKNEDSMIYNEPKDWPLPIKAYLGVALLKAGQFTSAENVFKEDLVDNPDNHWSLTGLLQALNKQKKETEAAVIKKQLEKTIASDDMKDLPVVF